jgi:hypothetical protein
MISGDMGRSSGADSYLAAVERLFETTSALQKKSNIHTGIFHQVRN